MGTGGTVFNSNKNGVGTEKNRLSSLPAEIRRAIFAFATVNPFSAVERYCTIPSSSTELTPFPRMACMSLFTVNRAISSEVEDIVYAQPLRLTGFQPDPRVIPMCQPAFSKLRHVSRRRNMLHKSVCTASRRSSRRACLRFTMALLRRTVDCAISSFQHSDSFQSLPCDLLLTRS